MTTKFAIVAAPAPALTTQPLPAEHAAQPAVAVTAPKVSLIDSVRGSSHFEGVSNVGGVLVKGVALATPPVTLAWSAYNLLSFDWYRNAQPAAAIAFLAGAGASAYGGYRHGTYAKIGAKYPTLSAFRDIMLYVVAPAVAVGWAVGSATDTATYGMLAGAIAGGAGVATQDQIDRAQLRRAAMPRPASD